MIKLSKKDKFLQSIKTADNPYLHIVLKLPNKHLSLFSNFKTD
tara:strand:- start:126 stop:254 length:129 start_codon:yes stop_codon:yes gene_type:complete